MKSIFIRLTDAEYYALKRQKKYEGLNWRAFINKLFNTYEEIIRGDEKNEK